MDGNAIIANDTLVEIANAIRAKSITPVAMKVSEMADKIMNIPPVERGVDVVVTGSLIQISDYRFSSGYSCDQFSFPYATSMGVGAFSSTNAYFYTFNSIVNVGTLAFSNLSNVPEIHLPLATNIGESAFINSTTSFIALWSISSTDVIANASYWGIASGSTVLCKDEEIIIIE